MGNLTPWELDLVTSPVARLRATFGFGGSVGRRFVDVAARLALSKWHTGRAMQGRQCTLSGTMILPLRQELHRLRGAVAVALRRPLPQPHVWYPIGSMPCAPRAPQHHWHHARRQQRSRA
jgi:hypothetical protein